MAKPKSVPVLKRAKLGDCELGDRVIFEDGREAVLSARISGAPFGRFVVNGEESEFQILGSDTDPIKRIGGYM
jgi:hypothetical protein